VSSNESSEREANQTQPLSADQITQHKAPESARISPDGSRILFTLRPASKSGEHGEAAIWAVDFADGEPFQFSTGNAEDEDPQWSPDGTQVAFLSDRAERGKSSVYVMPANGGESVRVFDQEGDMGSLSWSPDGNALSVLFTEPETEDEKKKKEEKDDVNVWDTDYKFRRLWAIDPKTKSAKCVSPPNRQVLHYAWSPDSQRFVINSTPTPNIDDIFKATDLSVIGRDGGEPAKIHEPYGDTHSLVWSGDGNSIAWVGPAGRVANADYVYVIPADGGEQTCLTEGYCGTIESLGLIDGGHALLAVGSESVNSAIYRIDWNGQHSQLLGTDRDGSIPDQATLSSDGKHLTFVWESLSAAPDVWVKKVDNHDSQPTRRTHFNPELETAALGQPELVRWQSDAEMYIEGILVTPHGYVNGERYPLIALIHGGPTWRWADAFHVTWVHSLAGRGFAVLLTNPRGSTGRGPAFSNAIYNDVGGGEFRDMMTGVDAMIERGIADPDRLGVGGWSWGGYMTAWTITQTTRFKAAIMGAGLPNMVSDNGIGDIPTANLSYFEKTVYEDPEPYWDRSAIKHLRNVTTPTLILHGEEDRRVAMPQGLELYTGLKTLGVETQFVTYPREPHGIQETKHQKDLIERVIEWYTKYLRS
jgi:dipeptidyl aminopeptidase/acylaminoacyl peptidase